METKLVSSKWEVILNLLQGEFEILQYGLYLKELLEAKRGLLDQKLQILRQAYVPIMENILWECQQGRLCNGVDHRLQNDRIYSKPMLML